MPTEPYHGYLPMNKTTVARLSGSEAVRRLEQKYAGTRIAFEGTRCRIRAVDAATAVTVACNLLLDVTDAKDTRFRSERLVDWPGMFAEICRIARRDIAAPSELDENVVISAFDEHIAGKMDDADLIFKHFALWGWSYVLSGPAARARSCAR